MLCIALHGVAGFFFTVAPSRPGWQVPQGLIEEVQAALEAAEAKEAREQEEAAVARMEAGTGLHFVVGSGPIQSVTQ